MLQSVQTKAFQVLITSSFVTSLRHTCILVRTFGILVNIIIAAPTAAPKLAFCVGSLQSLLADQDKYKLELMKFTIAVIVFFFSNDILKLSLAGATSVLAIYGICPIAEDFLLAPPDFLRQEKLFIDDMFFCARGINDLLNHVLLLLVLLLANILFCVLLLVSFVLGLPLRLCAGIEHHMNESDVHCFQPPRLQ